MNVRYTWSEFENDCYCMYRELVESNKQWRVLVPVTRDGLFVAGMLSHWMDIQLVDTLCLSSYEGTEQGKRVKILKKVAFHIDLLSGSGLLVVDAICDTGKTGEVVKTLYPQCTFASVLVKPQGEPVADHYGAKVSQNAWIIFPWDRE